MGEPDPDDAGPSGGRRQRVALRALLVLASLALVEVGARALYRPDYLYVADPRVGFRHAPGVRTAPDLVLSSTGWNDTERTREKPAGVTRVLVVGDSFAFGVTRREANFCSRLEALLAARHPDRRFEVMNAGTLSWGTCHEVAWLAADGLSYEPDLVLLLFYVGNDFSDNARGLLGRVVVHGAFLPFERATLARRIVRGYGVGRLLDDALSLAVEPALPHDERPEARDAARKARLEAAIEQGGLERLEEEAAAIARDLAFELEDLEGVPPERMLGRERTVIAALEEVMRAPVRLARERDGDTRGVGPALLAGLDRLHAATADERRTRMQMTREQWLGLAHAQQLAPFERDVDTTAHLGFVETERLLGELTTLCASRGVRAAVVLAPSELQVDARLRRDLFRHTGLDAARYDLEGPGPNAWLHATAARAGLPCLDLLDALRAADQVERMYYKFDTHWNPAGNRVAAMEVVRWLDGRGWPP